MARAYGQRPSTLLKGHYGDLAIDMQVRQTAELRIARILSELEVPEPFARILKELL